MTLRNRAPILYLSASSASIPNVDSTIYFDIEGGAISFVASIPNVDDTIYFNIEGGNPSYPATILLFGKEIYFNIEGGGASHLSEIDLAENNIYFTVDGGNVSYPSLIEAIDTTIYFTSEGGDLSIFAGASVPAADTPIYLATEGGAISFSTITPISDNTIYFISEGGEASHLVAIELAEDSIYFASEGGDISYPSLIENTDNTIYFATEGGDISVTAATVAPSIDADIYFNAEGGSFTHDATIPISVNDIYFDAEGGDLSINASIIVLPSATDIYLGVEGGSASYLASAHISDEEVYLSTEGGGVSYSVAVIDTDIDIYFTTDGGDYSLFAGTSVPIADDTVYIATEGGGASYPASIPLSTDEIYFASSGGGASYPIIAPIEQGNIYLIAEGGGVSYPALAPISDGVAYFTSEGGGASHIAEIPGNAITIFFATEGGGASIIIPNAATVEPADINIHFVTEGGDVLTLIPRIDHYLYDTTEADHDRIFSILQQKLREILTDETPILAEMEWAEDPGKFKVSGAIGTVEEALPYHDPLIPDEVNTIVANFTDETTVIVPPTAQDFLENKALLRLGDEVIAYRDVDVISYEPLIQQLSYLIRGIENLSEEVDPPIVPIHAENEDIMIGSIGFLRGGIMPYMQQKLRGTLLLPIGQSSASIPDETNILSIEMASASQRITPPSITDFWSGTGQLIKIEDEIITFRDYQISQENPLRYNLSYLLRGRLNSAATAHAGDIPVEIGFPELFDGSSLRPSLPAIYRKRRELDPNKWRVKTPGIFCIIHEDCNYKRIPFLGSSGAKLEIKIELIQYDLDKTLTVAVNRIVSSDLFDIVKEPRVSPLMELPQGTAYARAEIWICLDQWGKTKPV